MNPDPIQQKFAQEFASIPVPRALETDVRLAIDGQLRRQTLRDDLVGIGRGLLLLAAAILVMTTVLVIEGRHIHKQVSTKFEPPIATKPTER